MKIRCVLVIALLCSLFSLSCGAVEKYDKISPINLTIGFYKIPSDSVKMSLRKSLYHMNVAIREMTEGQHELGKVRVICEPKEHYHINWLRDIGGTGALAKTATYLPYSQNAYLAHNIRIGNNYTGEGNVTYDVVYDGKSYGYTLAHEAGHFIYGVFDEYKTWRFPGLIASPTVMEDQRAATDTGDVNALNFSTLFYYPLSDGWHLARTEQENRYPKSISCWGTLVGDEDPWGLFVQRSQYAELCTIMEPDVTKPAPHQYSSLPGDPLGDVGLDIKFGPAKRARIYLLDKSGSMGGPSFADAVDVIVKEIAKAPRGMNLGIYAFDWSPKPILEITEIPEDHSAGITIKKTMVRNLIDQAKAMLPIPTDHTALYHSLDKLLDTLNTKMSSLGLVIGDIIVVTDGMDDVGGASETDVIKKSREYFIPIHITGLNMSPNEVENYRDFTKKMGGAFSDGYIHETHFFANGEKIDSSIPPTNDSDSVLREWKSIDKKELGGRRREGRIKVLNHPNDVKFYIDKALINFNVFITHSGLENDVKFILLSPSGIEYPLEMLYSTDEFELGSGFLAEFITDPAMVGEWILKSANNTDSEVSIFVNVQGESLTASEIQKDVVHSIFVGQSMRRVFNTAEFPIPRTINFVTQYGGDYLTDLDIEAKIEDIYGNVTILQPKDDGISPDFLANDGIYTVLHQGTVAFPASNPATYTLTSKINNRHRKAYTTKLAGNNVEYPAENLDGPSPNFGEPIRDNFERTAVTSYSVIRDSETANPRGMPLSEPPLLLQLGNIDGVKEMLLGIEMEFSADMIPQDVGNLLKDYISWSLSPNSGAVIIPDPEGRPNVVKVRFDSHNQDVNLSISNTVPNALKGLVVSQTKNWKLSTNIPYFYGPYFEKETPVIVFTGDSVRFDGTMKLPSGYSSTARWSIKNARDVHKQPSDISEIVQQDDTGCTVKAISAGEYTLCLTSIPYPDLISNSFNIKVIHREQPGEQPGNPDDNSGSQPSPGNNPDDLGGDDDVETTPDTGDNGGGSDEEDITPSPQPSNPENPDNPDSGGDPDEPEIPDLEEPVVLPPEIFQITLDGRDIAGEGNRVIEQGKTVQIVFKFKTSIDRYTLSAVLLSQTKGESSISTLSNEELSQDGMMLTCKFTAEFAGQHRISYSFERKDGIKTTGDFVLAVKEIVEQSPSPDVDIQDSRGGSGCNVGVSLLFATFSVLFCFRTCKHF